MVRIKNLALENFRCFEKLQFDLSPKVNLFIGNNGCGKSAILDALAIGLGPIATHLPDISGISFKRNDIRQVDGYKSSYTRVTLRSFDDIEWDVTQKRDKSKKTNHEVPRSKGIKKLTAFLDADILDKYNDRVNFEMPFFGYYGVSRAIIDIPLNRKGFNKTTTRFDALAGSLLADNRFRSAFVWFYNKENEEHRRQKDKKNFDFQLKELNVVRTAISIMFPDLREPHVDVNPLRFMIKKDGESLVLDQLSDGYKTMLGLVMDLSSRLAMANPHIENPLESEAIVMIDEVDLHLHPSWQQHVIGDLIRIFPNTQFILTTHSPYIVESLNNHLKKAIIQKYPVHDQDISVIEPLYPDMVKAYLVEDGQLQNIVHQDYGLIDDRLLHIFNKINGIYDKMRDIEWESAND